MDVLPVVGFGFALGMRHALEADHVAAVASLSTRVSSFRTAMKVAAAWGVGHASSLLALGFGIVLAGSAGASTGSARAGLPPSFLLRRATLVGGVHGLGGTGALMLLALPAMGTRMQALGGLALFGAGTIAGMVLFSAALSLPLGLSSRFLAAARWTEALVAFANVAVGCWMLAPAFS